MVLLSEVRLLLEFAFGMDCDPRDELLLLLCALCRRW